MENKLSLEYLLVALIDFVKRLLHTFNDLIFRFPIFIEAVFASRKTRYTQPYTFLFVSFTTIPLFLFIYSNVLQDGLIVFAGGYGTLDFIQVTSISLIPFILTHLAINVFLYRVKFEKSVEKIFTDFIQYQIGSAIIVFFSLFAICGVILSLSNVYGFYLVYFVSFAFVLFRVPRMVKDTELAIVQKLGKDFKVKFFRGTLLLGGVAVLGLGLSAWISGTIFEEPFAAYLLTAKSYNYDGPHRSKEIQVEYENVSGDSITVNLDLIISNTALDRNCYLRCQDTFKILQDWKTILYFITPKKGNDLYVKIPPTEFERVTMVGCFSAEQWKELDLEESVRIEYPYYTILKSNFKRYVSAEAVDRIQLRKITEIN